MGISLLWPLSLLPLIYCFFEKLEDIVTNETKHNLSEWLYSLNRKSKSYNKWPLLFIKIFDDLFGKKHFTLNCFMRSSIASFFAVLILFIVWVTLKPNQGASFLNNGQILYSFGTFFSINFVIDYISLLETRHIIYLMTKAKNKYPIMILLLVDFLLTSIIGITAWIIFELLVFNVSFSAIYKKFITLVLQFNTEIEGHPSFGIFFYSSYLTSIWVWFFCISTLIFKFISKHKYYNIYNFDKIIDVKNKPLRTVGIFSCLIVSIIYLFIITLYCIFWFWISKVTPLLKR